MRTTQHTYGGRDVFPPAFFIRNGQQLRMRGHMIRGACTLTLMACLSMTIGCGGGTKLHHVEGLVTLDGQPLEGAMVTFTNGNQIATGLTTASGKFKLLHLGKEGCPAGTFKVTVSKIEAMMPADMAPAPDGNPTEMYKKTMEKMGVKPGVVGGGSFKPKSLVPEKYKNPGALPDQIVPATSEIKIELSGGAKKS
jgi:hypothetical protein